MAAARFAGTRRPGFAEESFLVLPGQFGRKIRVVLHGFLPFRLPVPAWARRNVASTMRVR